MSDTVLGGDRMVAIVAAALAVNPGVEKIPERARVIVEALIAASGGPDHILQMKQGVWTVQHPLHERFGNEPLFDCRYFDLIQIAWGQGAFGRDGNHRLWIDRGVLMWEELP